MNLNPLYNIEYLRNLDIVNLEEYSEQIRKELIDIVYETGGHLGANLGVVELTIALHYVFNTPEDKIIWDVGHQAYIHKMLTYRHERIRSLRQNRGICGFTLREESEFDPFGAGHSSTSISAALGFATARDLSKQEHEVIAVIGDGAISAGMAYEGLNNLGNSATRMIVILNDNRMSISPAVGAFHNYLIKLTSSKRFLNIRKILKSVNNKLPHSIRDIIKDCDQYTRAHGTQHGNIFEELGFHYIGPIDGHDIVNLVIILENISKSQDILNKPILLHVLTEKGRNFPNVDAQEEKFHAIGKSINSSQVKSSSDSPIIKNPTYSNVFGDTLCNLAKNNNKILAITAAMKSGTGLAKFAKEYPKQFFDVGIAEQHAVTFAAGLACEGYRPYVAIYSTFLQRAYDQIIHDVAIQNLPVCFCIDRAGIGGEDGPTHAGSFDLSYLSIIPNMIVTAPANGIELEALMKFFNTQNSPMSIRYPKGECYISNIRNQPIYKSNITYEEFFSSIQFGKIKQIYKGSEKLLVISIGSIFSETEKAIMESEYDLSFACMSFIRPLDTESLENFALNYDNILVIEESSFGGGSQHISNFYMSRKIDIWVDFVQITHEFLPHGDTKSLRAKLEMNSESIQDKIREIL